MAARGPVAGKGKPPDSRPDQPSWARMWNYWLGGSYNYEADREQASVIEKIIPQIRRMAASNRMFVGRAIGWAAASKGIRGGGIEPGVDQVVDLGCGYPPSSPVHAMIQTIRTPSGVAYVDIDPGVVDLAYESLTPGEREWVAVALADIRDPAGVFTAIRQAGPGPAGVIDLAEPVCLLLAGVLPILPAAQAAELVAEYVAMIAPGSYVAISAGRLDSPVMEREFAAACNAPPAANFTQQEVAALFAGLELEEPGIAPVIGLRPGWSDYPSGSPGPAYLLGGIGRKPG